MNTMTYSLISLLLTLTKATPIWFFPDHVPFHRLWSLKLQPDPQKSSFGDASMSVRVPVLRSHSRQCGF